MRVKASQLKIGDMIKSNYCLAYHVALIAKDETGVLVKLDPCGRGFPWQVMLDPSEVVTLIKGDA